MTGNGTNGEDLADIDMTQMDDADSDVVQVVDGDETFLYTAGDDCAMCWRDAVAVMVKDAEFRKVHDSVCEECVQEIEEDDADSEYEVRYFD